MEVQVSDEEAVSVDIEGASRKFPHLSVVICTYNRSGTLATALGSVLACDVPSGLEWEVVVVDNNSQDETRAVVERAMER